MGEEPVGGSQIEGRNMRRAERRDASACSEREGDRERHHPHAASLQAAAGRQSRCSCKVLLQSISSTKILGSSHLLQRSLQCSGDENGFLCTPGAREGIGNERKRGRDRWGFTRRRCLQWTQQVEKHCWQESQSGEMQSTFREEREKILHCIALTQRERKMEEALSCKGESKHWVSS